MNVLFVKPIYKDCNYINLTYVKSYEVINTHPLSINDQMYEIIDDNGSREWYSINLVMPLDQWRELKLNELLNGEL